MRATRLQDCGRSRQQTIGAVTHGQSSKLTTTRLNIAVRERSDPVGKSLDRTVVDRRAMSRRNQLDPAATAPAGARNLEAIEVQGHAFGDDLNPVRFGDVQIGG